MLCGNREDNIQLEDVLDILTGHKSRAIQKCLTDNNRIDYRVRKGKYGPYIFYKTESTMKKPRFLKLPKDREWKSMQETGEYLVGVKKSMVV